MTKILLLETEVADRLGVSKSDVRHLRASGKLGFAKVGGSVRIFEHQLAEYLENERLCKEAAAYKLSPEGISEESFRRMRIRAHMYWAKRRLPR